MRIYLDHNASSPMREPVEAALRDALALAGNPASAHREGAAARAAIEHARGQVAALIGARPADIVFTSGATEANNFALWGTLAPGQRLVTTAIEHASILEPARALQATGVDVVELSVRRDGTLVGGEVAGALAKGVRLVSIALANGEIGVVHDLPALAGAASAAGALVHTDAVQAVGRMPVDVTALGADLVSLSSHKIGGPAGAGALWIRPGLRLAPQLRGGPQERGTRAGTPNLLGIVGFGAAAELVQGEGAAAFARMREARDHLWSVLQARISGVERNGPDDGGLPNTLNVFAPGVSGEALLVRLDLAGVAASLGSACAAGGAEPSHVLRALGFGPDRVRSSLRLSVGPDTSRNEAGRAAEIIAEVVADIRRQRAAS